MLWKLIFLHHEGTAGSSMRKIRITIPFYILENLEMVDLSRICLNQIRFMLNTHIIFDEHLLMGLFLMSSPIFLLFCFEASYFPESQLHERTVCLLRISLSLNLLSKFC